MLGEIIISSNGLFLNSPLARMFSLLADSVLVLYNIFLRLTPKVVGSIPSLSDFRFLKSFLVSIVIWLRDVNVMCFLEEYLMFSRSE